MNEREWIKSMDRGVAPPIDVTASVLRDIRAGRVPLAPAASMRMAALVGISAAVVIACVAGVELWQALNADPLADWLGGWTIGIQ